MIHRCRNPDPGIDQIDAGPDGRQGDDPVPQDGVPNGQGNENADDPDHADDPVPQHEDENDWGGVPDGEDGYVLIPIQDQDRQQVIPSVRN